MKRREAQEAESRPSLGQGGHWLGVSLVSAI